MVMPSLLNPAAGLQSWPVWLFVLALIWSAVWKGFALWKAAKKDSKYWFIALLVVNTLGILEILYLFVFSEMKTKGKRRR
jgi:hypothetical protein